MLEDQKLLEVVRERDREDWREWYHGEHAASSYDPDNRTQYLIDGGMMYVWNPVTNRALLFDVGADPGEEKDLTSSNVYVEDLERGRAAMVGVLSRRPETFVEDGEPPRPPARKGWAIGRLCLEQLTPGRPQFELRARNASLAFEQKYFIPAQFS